METQAIMPPPTREQSDAFVRQMLTKGRDQLAEEQAAEAAALAEKQRQETDSAQAEWQKVLDAAARDLGAHLLHHIDPTLPCGFRADHPDYVVLDISVHSLATIFVWFARNRQGEWNLVERLGSYFWIARYETTFDDDGQKSVWARPSAHHEYMTHANDLAMALALAEVSGQEKARLEKDAAESNRLHSERRQQKKRQQDVAPPPSNGEVLLEALRQFILAEAPIDEGRIG